MRKSSKAFLSLRDISKEKVNDPIGNFYSGIKSPATKVSYTKTLREFLMAIKEFDGTFEIRAEEFAELASKHPDSAKGLLKNYAKFLKERTEKPTHDTDYLKPSVVPNKFKGIKKFLEMNEIAIEWKGIEAIFPEITNLKQTRGYTTEEIQQILQYCTEPISEFLILVNSSSGIRVGAWEKQVWGNIRPIYKSKDGYTHDISKAESSDVICASMVIYENTSYKYLALISIEAWDKLQVVRQRWIAKMHREPKPDDYIIITRFSDKRQFSKDGIRNKIFKIIERSGVQKPLTEGERVHDVPITHGFRKRWNKIMSEQKINGDSYGNLIRKERLFGHKVGVTNLDNSYFFSKIEESVPQYLQAMPELMITEEYRSKVQLKTIQDENIKLRKTIQEKDDALVMVRELKAKFERFEKYEKKD